jgi:Domain of unknown function (DUF4126)
VGDHTLIQLLSTVGLAIALAACAGLRAWLPLLMAGALSRAGVLSLGGAFGFLSSNKALALFALATAIELVGDKIPAVDHALDALSTVLRPAAGAMLAASVFGRIADPLESAALGLAVGAPVAFVPHAGKTVLRAASSTFTAGLANPALSVTEDVATIVLFLLAVLVPIAVASALLILCFVLLRRFTRPSAASTVATA